MNSQAPPPDPPRGILPYIVAFLLIMLLLIGAWILAHAGHSMAFAVALC